MSYIKPTTEKEISKINGKALADIACRDAVNQMGNDVSELMETVIGDPESDSLSNQVARMNEHFKREFEGTIEYTDATIEINTGEKFTDWKVFAITFEYDVDAHQNGEVTDTYHYKHSALGVLDEDGNLYFHNPAPYLDNILLAIDSDTDEGTEPGEITETPVPTRLVYLGYAEAYKENMSLSKTPTITKIVGII